MVVGLWCCGIGLTEVYGCRQVFSVCMPLLVQVSADVLEFYETAHFVRLPTEPWVYRLPEDRIKHVAITNDEVSDIGEQVLLWRGGEMGVDYDLFISSGKVDGELHLQMPVCWH